MKQKDPRIAVLITVHNRREKTLRCLEALSSQSGEGRDICCFLVDDGSTDGTSEAVASAFPWVKIIPGTGDLFWNRGMHCAWEAAEGQEDFDFYLWLNDDTTLYPFALDSLLKTSAQHQDTGIVIGTTCSTQDPGELTYGGVDAKGRVIPPKTDTDLSAVTFNGNIVLIPRAVFNILGKNDPVFRHAIGDTDYGLRARKAGVALIIAPRVLGTCDAHPQLPAWRNPDLPFARRWQALRSPLGQNPEEFFYFEKRHYGLFTAVFHYLTTHLRVVIPGIKKG